MNCHSTPLQFAFCKLQFAVLCSPSVPRDKHNSAQAGRLKRRMPEPGRPPRNRRIVRLLVIFVASLILADGLVGARGLAATLRARHEYEALSAEIDRQRAENARLREEARRLTEDPQAIEEVARRELGLIKPGEKVFIVKDVTPAQTPQDKVESGRSGKSGRSGR
jgi:cell division protein FtsB